MVYEIKDGSCNDADVMLVTLYMALLPYSKPFKGRVFEGSVSGTPAYVNIPAATVDDKFRHRVRAVLDILGRSEPPPRVPGIEECRACQIQLGICPERIAE
jgi:hypothetical protein